MPSLESRTAESRCLAWRPEELARERRKNRVLSLVAAGLPMPQGRVFDLLRLLREPVLDLAGLTKIIRTEPQLQTHLLGLFAASPREAAERPFDLSEAVVLLGSERLRMLALGCSVAEFASRRLPLATLRAFWRHSILTGVLSQKIAREVDRDLAETAYLAGLLHDVGRLPLLIAAWEQQARGEPVPLTVDDDPVREQEYFGTQHGEIGRWIAISAGCARSIVDVLAHHHETVEANDDPVLVAIVAAADRASESQSEAHRPPDTLAKIEPCGELLDLARPRGLLKAHRAALSQFLAESRSGSAPYPYFGGD